MQSQLARLPKPSGREVDFVKLWKKDTKRGRVYLVGDDDNILEDWDLRELQSINGQHYDDAISDWMTRHVIYWYHRLIGQYYKVRVSHFQCMDVLTSSERQETFEHGNSCLFARRPAADCINALHHASSVFPIASILILYRVKSLEARLWVIVAFTVLFAACVGAFSPGKRVETFAATMA